MKRLVLALALLAAPLLASADRFTAITVDTRAERLELFLKDDTGAPFRRLDRLDTWLKSQKRQLRFAMNAGMYEPDLSPVGLFVARGHELSPLNLAEGAGNFYLKPNGVFFLTAGRKFSGRRNTRNRRPGYCLPRNRGRCSWKTA